MWKSLRCPYCNSNITPEESITEDQFSYGVCSCSCDEYPVVENILFLKKNDFLTNKGAVELIRKHKDFQALSLCLSETAPTHKALILMVLIVGKYFKYLPSLTTLLKLLRVVGPSRSWFSYLLTRSLHPDFQLSHKLLTKDLSSSDVLIDAGCGIGLLRQLLGLSKFHNFIYFGVDKSFLSLCIAQLYHRYPKTYWICTDMEAGLPFRTGFIQKVIYLDSFSWIFSKIRAIEESARILEHKGKLYLIHVHSTIQQTHWWGYAIHIEKLVKLLGKFYRLLNILNETGSQLSLKKQSNQPKILTYSCLGIRK